MKKRIAALLMAAVITVGAAGCGVFESLRKTDTPAEVETPTPVEEIVTETPTDTPADNITPEITADPAAAEPTDDPGEVPEPDIRFLTTDFDGNGWDETCFYENKVTMINLWAYWCGPCVGELPDLNKLSEDYADKGLQIIGISLKEEEAENRETVKELGITYPNLFYTEEFDEYMDTGYYPTTIFVDNEGQVLGNACIGSREYKDWAKMIDDLLKE